MDLDTGTRTACWSASWEWWMTEAGYKAQQMNTFMNVKTAEKTLQFGPTKCKSMLVGKGHQLLDSDLHVDSWTVQYKDNIETGDVDLIETFDGQVVIEKATEQKYLGFILSSTGDNMVNIIHMKNKYIGIIRQICNRLESLHLKKCYHFHELYVETKHTICSKNILRSERKRTKRN